MLSKFCSDQEQIIVKQFSELNHETQSLILTTVGKDYKELSKEDLAELIENVQNKDKLSSLLKEILLYTGGMIVLVPVATITIIYVFVMPTFYIMDAIDLIHK